MAIQNQENVARWFEIYVQNMDRAKKFYEGVLQRKLEKVDTPDFDMWSFTAVKDKPGCTGALVRIEGVPSGGNSVIVYFGSDDCAHEAARVAKFGGRIHKEKFSIGKYGFIALAYDPEGNMFGLHSLA